MSEIERDSVHNYRPGPQSELPLDPGEKVTAVFEPDPKRYCYDTAVLAGFGIVLVGAALAWMGKVEQIAVAAVAIAAGMALRALYFRSEAFARRWQLTDRRLVGPQGRQVMLLEIRQVRRLMGDVQIVTKAGDKNLIKHLGDSAAVMATIEAARAKRARVKH